MAITQKQLAYIKNHGIYPPSFTDRATYEFSLSNTQNILLEYFNPYYPQSFFDFGPQQSLNNRLRGNGDTIHSSVTDELRISTAVAERYKRGNRNIMVVVLKLKIPKLDLISSDFPFSSIPVIRGIKVGNRKWPPENNLKPLNNVTHKSHIESFVPHSISHKHILNSRTIGFPVPDFETF